MGSGHVQRELENLTHAGPVPREERARQVYYRPDPKAPVVEELRAIVFKAFGVTDVLRKALLPLAAKIRLAFIHGSVAREEDTAGSDIDVIIAGRASLMEAAKLLAQAEALLKRRVSTTIYTRAEYSSSELHARRRAFSARRCTCGRTARPWRKSPRFFGLRP